MKHDVCFAVKVFVQKNDVFVVVIDFLSVVVIITMIIIIILIDPAPSH